MERLSARLWHGSDRRACSDSDEQREALGGAQAGSRHLHSHQVEREEHFQL